MYLRRIMTIFHFRNLGMSLEPANTETNEPEIWTQKPWWCQPWSIVLTTIVVPTLSWFVLHWIWLTGILALGFLLWMAFFLGVYPRLIRLQRIGDRG